MSLVTAYPECHKQMLRNWFDKIVDFIIEKPINDNFNIFQVNQYIKKYNNTDNPRTQDKVFTLSTYPNNYAVFKQCEGINWKCSFTPSRNSIRPDQIFHTKIKEKNHPLYGCKLYLEVIVSDGYLTGYKLQLMVPAMVLIL